MISNMHRNIMGTVSFDGVFPGMRKAQDFIVYPVQEHESPSILKIQSDHVFGYLDTRDGTLTYAKGRDSSGLMYTCAKLSGALKTCVIPAEELAGLTGAVRDTASHKAGSNGIVFCDNSGASRI